MAHASGLAGTIVETIVPILRFPTHFQYTCRGFSFCQFTRDYCEEIGMKAVARMIFSVSVFLYRVSGGRIGGTMRGNGVLLLTTTGRKTGKSRTLPVLYIRDGEAYVITASAGGPRHPGWFFNLRSNPQATILVKKEQIKVTAEIAGPEKKSELWPRLVAVAPYFEGYQKRTTREFPMVILHPVKQQAAVS
jgi:deazaflavin-dependent oxidoreductase (nitroreductase family)